MSDPYSLVELQQARDAHRYALSLRESLRLSPSTATKENRSHDALIYLKLLERELNPEKLPPARQARFRGPVEVRVALEDLRDACYKLGDCWGCPNIWSGDSTATPFPLTMPDPPAETMSVIADAVDRLAGGLERYLKKRSSLLTCPNCHWMQEVNKIRPNRPTVCPRCETVIREPGQISTNFQIAYSAADQLLKYCRDILDLARGQGDSGLLLTPRESWPSTSAAMIRRLADFLPSAKADLCPALDEIKAVAKARTIAGVSGKSAHHAVLELAERIAELKDVEWPDLQPALAVPPFVLGFEWTVLAEECAAAERAAQVRAKENGEQENPAAPTKISATSAGTASGADLSLQRAMPATAISKSQEIEARDACCECARLTASFINLVHDDATLIRAMYERDGTPVNRAIEPADFAALAERIWAMLRRACDPMRELADKLARCNVGAVVTFNNIFESSYHATGGELAFRVLNNARMVAGYPPIFPSVHHPEGYPPFFEHCRHHPEVFDMVSSQGFEEIGKRWDLVRTDLKETFTPYNAEILIGLIRKEAAQCAAMLRRRGGQSADADGAASRVQALNYLRLFDAVIALFETVQQDGSVEPANTPSLLKAFEELMKALGIDREKTWQENHQRLGNIERSGKSLPVDGEGSI